MPGKKRKKRADSGLPAGSTPTELLVNDTSIPAEEASKPDQQMMEVDATIAHPQVQAQHDQAQHDQRQHAQAQHGAQHMAAGQHETDLQKRSASAAGNQHTGANSGEPLVGGEQLEPRGLAGDAVNVMAAENGTSQQANGSKTDKRSAKQRHKEQLQQKNQVQEQQLCKSAQRKLRQIQQKAERRAQVEKALVVLESSKLVPEHLKLLQPIHSRGGTETKKERVRRAWNLRQAGLPVDNTSGLFQQRREREDASDSAASSSDESDVPAAGSQACMPGARPSAPASQAAGAPTQENTEPAAKRAKLGQDAASQPQRQTSDDGPLQKKQKHPTAKVAVQAHDPVARKVVQVSRKPAVEASRAKLPIIGMEQEVMEAVAQNDVILICGETGCGKTTQVPQFLYEAGYGSPDFPECSGRIGVTQPRRVAAVSTAERLAAELNSPLGDVVGYQIRHDKAVGGRTAIKFMTDGILLAELRQDLLLRSYSVVVIDEAHERSLNTDLLIGLLSRAVPLRRKLHQEWKAKGGGAPVQPLKLIIMSATLQAQDFQNNPKLFASPPPIVQVPGRQFPVVVHFAKHTELEDFIRAAVQKVAAIHNTLPPGGILVFLTGAREVEQACRTIRRQLEPSKRMQDPTPRPTPEPENPATEQADELNAVTDLGLSGADEMEAALEFGSPGDGSEDELEIFDQEDEEDMDEEEEEVWVVNQDGSHQTLNREQLEQLKQREGGAGLSVKPAGLPNGAARVPLAPHVLPLYAMLPRAQQAQVFEAVPDGKRLIVVATNVAETSLTIPGIRYVVDAGRAKVKLLGPGGASRYDVSWISKASAQQRCGRAGRTMAGHCYRLFSSAHFHHNFPEYSSPEIVNTPLEDVVLGMKSMAIDQVQNFPFPTVPASESLKQAEQILLLLGALSSPSPYCITPLGSHMANLPVSPRISRMLLWLLQPKQARKLHARMAPYAVALAAAAGIESPFMAPATEVSTEAAGQPPENTTSSKPEPASTPTPPQASAPTPSLHPHTAQSHRPNLRCADSDLVNAMVALCAYLSAPNKAAFCADHHLHARHLKEMAAVQLQLLQSVVHQVAKGQWRLEAGVVEALERCLESGGALESPPPKVQSALRQGVAAGWPDQVAHRVKSESYLNKLADRGRRVAVRYATCQGSSVDTQFVYLHPRSILARAAPEFVVYGQLVTTEKRTYMADVTAVEARWLHQTGQPLCHLSEPLDDPPPRYKREADAVLSWHDVAYGPHRWPLPRLTRAHPVAKARATYFAAALLAGEVFPVMAELKPLLALPPRLLLQPEMHGVTRVQALVTALVDAKVDSAQTLAKTLMVQKKFLQQELGMCLKKQHANSLKYVWPKFLEEAERVVANARSGHV